MLNQPGNPPPNCSPPNQNYVELAAATAAEMSPDEHRRKLTAWLAQAQADIDALQTRVDAYEAFLDTLFPMVSALVVDPLRGNYRAAAELSRDFDPDTLARLPFSVERKVEIVKAWEDILTGHDLPIPSFFDKVLNQDSAALLEIAFPPDNFGTDTDEGSE